MTHTVENDAATYTRADMARAWDEGERWRARRGDLPAILGGENPYRVIPPDVGQR